MLILKSFKDDSDEDVDWEYWDEYKETARPDFLKIDEGFEV